MKEIFDHKENLMMKVGYLLSLKWRNVKEWVGLMSLIRGEKSGGRRLCRENKVPMTAFTCRWISRKMKEIFWAWTFSPQLVHMPTNIRSLREIWKSSKRGGSEIRWIRFMSEMILQYMFLVNVCRVVCGVGFANVEFFEVNDKSLPFSARRRRRLPWRHDTLLDRDLCLHQLTCSEFLGCLRWISAFLEENVLLKKSS